MALKIAVVVGQFPAVSETFIINQIGFLKQSGHTVDILCLGKKNNGLVSHPILNTYKLIDDAYVFNWRGLMPLHKLKRWVMAICILSKSFGSPLFFKFLNSLNPMQYGKNAINFHQIYKTYFSQFFVIEHYDVVHVHFADYAVQILPQIQRFKRKLIVTFHGYDAHNFDPGFYQSLQNLKHIQYTVNTNFTKEKIIELGFNPSKITVLPVGLDTNFFKPNKKEHPTFNILFVGRLIELKAPLLAIKILEALKKQNYLNAYLNIVGSGIEYEKCKKYIDDNNLQDYVTLHGTKSQDEIKDFMNLSDVFLYPGIIDKTGRCENQGLVIQEAQAMELPVIISDVGGMQEGIVDGKTGHVIKAGDIEGFVSCLKSFIDDSTKQKKMGKVARSFAVEHYDISILGNQLLNLYTDE